MPDHKMVLTAIGPDRPGLVKEISAIIHEAGGNLEDSRMVVLAGDFALLVLFSGSADTIEAIRERSRELESRLDFQIRFKPASARKQVSEVDVYELIVSGVDQSGIVHQVSTVIAGLELNVISLESRLESAAFHGTALFHLKAEIQIRDETSLDLLHDKLDSVCENLHLTYDLQPLPDPKAS